MLRVSNQLICGTEFHFRSLKTKIVTKKTKWKVIFQEIKSILIFLIIWNNFALTIKIYYFLYLNLWRVWVTEGKVFWNAIVSEGPRAKKK